MMVRAWAGGLLPGVRARRAQVAEFARQWDESNHLARAERGPLWLVLGDSTAQAIGASSREGGYVLSTLERLRDQRDENWRVINLSRSGATVTDIIVDQLPRLAEVPSAALVSCAAGANDLLRTTPGGFEAALHRLIEALPTGALIASVPQGIRSTRATAANEIISSRAAERDLIVVDLWGHTGPPWKGRVSGDFFHPNDLGYAAWTAAFCEALSLRV